VQDTIKLLVQLQQTDTIVFEKLKLIETAPMRIGKADIPLKNAKYELDMSMKRADALLSARREKERALEEIKEKTTKLKARSADIKTNKEYQAMMKEIESFEKDMVKTEEELLKAMDEINALDKEIKGKQNIVREEEERLGEVKNAIESETAALHKELSSLKTERIKIAAGLDADTYNRYLDLLMKCRGTAVCRVEDEICLGCNMNIPPQLYVQVKKGTDIVQCPQCDRILYCEPV